MAVAGILPDGYVDRLIYIANDGVKERKGHWYTLGIPVNHRYMPFRKYLALARLGGTGSEKALDYMSKLMEEKEDSHITRFPDGGWISETSHRHPNAPDYLQRVLNYQSVSSWEPDGMWDTKHPKMDKTEAFIGAVIARLEQGADASTLG